MLDTLTTEELRAAIANATGDDDAAPECTCAAKDMTFGRCCKVTPNASLSGRGDAPNHEVKRHVPRSA